MTRFSMLSKLMQRNYPGDNWEIQAAHSYLEEFDMYAIVLCRPDDKEFIDKMSENFSDLDVETGKNLLFFSLAQPGVTTEAYRMSMSPVEAMRDTEKYPVDEFLYLYLLTQSLKVSLNDFPLIIVTDWLRSSRWYVIKTSVDRIYYDLAFLNNKALNPNFHFDTMMEDVLDRIVGSAGHYWYEVNSKFPLCQLLAGVEASAATQSNDPDKSKKALETIKEIEGCLQGFKDKEAHDLFFLLRSIRKSPSSGKWRDNIGKPQPLYVNSSDLERETLDYLEVYSKVLSVFDENRLVDYSAVGTLVHKVFESELNASILQLMRYSRNIPMPEYYKKWCDMEGGKYTIKTANGMYVSLNKYINGNPKRYISPGLGKSYYAFQKMCEWQQWNELCSQFGFDEKQLKEFADLWENIFNIRNSEAHCQPMMYEDYLNLTNSVNQVLQQFLTKMVKIKKRLKP